MRHEVHRAKRWNRSGMSILVVLHVVAAFVAFAFTAGVGIYLGAIASSGDVRAIRTAVKTAAPLMTAGAILLVIAVVVGFGVAARAGFDLSSTWLIAADVLAALILVMGLGIHRPWTMRLGAAAAASPDDHASPELTAIIRDRAAQAAGPISGLLWLCLISDMVLRP